MTWSYDPEDLPEIKHRDALRGSLPPGAMRDEPTSEAERRDMYANGDPLLRYHLDQTMKQQEALHRNDHENFSDTLHSVLRGQGFPEAQRPGDRLINPTPNDLSSLEDDGEEQEEDDEPFYRVWHENGDYVGGSASAHRAQQIMGGHILNHLAEERDAGEECPGCGVMTPPANHGFSIQPVNGADDMEDLPPKYSRAVGAISRAGDSIWR